MTSWCWESLNGAHVETCVCSLGSPPQVTAQGGGVLCRGLPAGRSQAGRVSIPRTAGPSSQPCPEDGSIGWAGDRSTPGRWSAVPWGQSWGWPGLLCQHSTEDPLGNPLPHMAVSSRFPNHPSPYSRLPVSSREIINGVTVTDGDNNELGCSRVSLGMGVQVGAWYGGGSSTTLVCRGRRRRASHRLWSPGSPWQHQE